MKAFSWCVLAVLLMLLFFPGMQGFAQASGNVNIPDQYLLSAVRGALNKPTGDITAEDMGSLTELWACDMNIVALTGLEHAMNLQFLNLEGNRIEELGPLNNLTMLQWLILADNRITVVDDLSALGNLKLLVLEDNEIENIIPLGGLNKLEGLYLRSNRISSLPGLSGLSSLQALDLGDNNIINIQPLSNLSTLKHLSLDANFVSSLTPLSGLVNLQSLDLGTNLLTDVFPLTGFSHLEELWLDGNTISNISPLANLTKLTYLNLQGNPVDNHPDSAQMQAVQNIQHSGAVVLHDGRVKRISGPNRYLTAARISQNGWRWSSNTVIIARGDDYADALAGVSLARQLNAPILLTRSDQLLVTTKNEILRLGPSRAIVLGNVAAVSEQVKQELEELVAVVERIGGSNRFDTAVLIAERLIQEQGALGPPNTAVIAYSHNFPDALAAASYAAANGYPVLLTRTDQLSGATLNFLTARDIDNTVVVGSEGVIGSAVMAALPNPVRVSGRNRYETAVALAIHFDPGTSHFYVATGIDFPDAISGAVLAAKQNSGILLVQRTAIPGAVSSFINNYGVRQITIFGGEPVVSLSTATALYNLLPASASFGLNSLTSSNRSQALERFKLELIHR